MAAAKSVQISTGTGTSDTNLWQSILAEATESVHRSQEGHLLVIGRGTTPHLVIDALQWVADVPEEGRMGSELCDFVVDFAHLDLKDRGGVNRGLQRPCALWVIDDPSRKNVLLTQMQRRGKKGLSDGANDGSVVLGAGASGVGGAAGGNVPVTSFLSGASGGRERKLGALIVLNLDEPWGLMDQLEKAMILLEDILGSILTEEDRENGRKEIESYFRKMTGWYARGGKADPAEEVNAANTDGQDGKDNNNATDNNKSADAKSPKSGNSSPSAGNKSPSKSNDAGDNVDAENPEDSLPKLVSRNFGIPIIFILARAEVASAIQEAKKTKGWMDAVSLHLRNKAFECGGALFAHSAETKARNSYQLYDYLGHRLFGFELTMDNCSPEVENMMELRVPSGFDTGDKIIDDARDTVAEGIKPAT